MTEKLRPVIEDMLYESLYGIRRGIQNHIFTIKHITQQVHQDKGKTFLAFIDLETAFGRV